MDRLQIQSAYCARPHWRERNSGDAAVIEDDEDRLFVAIVDVLGHGDEAHALAVEIDAYLRLHRALPPHVLLLQVHDAFKGSRGAAIGLCSIDKQAHVLHYSGAGNTALRIVGDVEKQLISLPGVVGERLRTPRIEQVELRDDDLILLYTDGISSRFTQQDYPQMRLHPPVLVAQQILARFGKSHDDATCIALRCQP